MHAEHTFSASTPYRWQGKVCVILKRCCSIVQYSTVQQERPFVCVGAGREDGEGTTQRGGAVFRAGVEPMIIL